MAVFFAVEYVYAAYKKFKERTSTLATLAEEHTSAATKLEASLKEAKRQDIKA